MVIFLVINNDTKDLYSKELSLPVHTYVLFTLPGYHFVKEVAEVA